MSELLLPGLVSVTFRNLPWEEIVDLTAGNGLRGIEWGGDVHVPPGDLKRAAAVKKASAEQNLLISAYGSYYRAGGDPAAFAPVLDSALALGAQIIRVWAGNVSSKEITAVAKSAIADDLRRCCALAARHGITIATEFHAGTLTDDADACVNLIDSACAENLETFWQPPNGMELDSALQTLHRVRHKLSNIHVFHWWPTSNDRHPLQTGRDRWQQYLSIIAAQCRTDSRRRFASLEFVQNDDIDQFKRDAITLTELLTIANAPLENASTSSNH